MGEVMSAGLFRLKRDKVFWACMVLMAALAAVMMANSCRVCRGLAAEGYSVDVGAYYFQLAPAVELCMGVFTGLYLGTDHSEGALRNRLIVGHSRREVYLAGLGMAFAGALCFTAAWLLGGGGAALLLGWDLWRMGAGQVALYILVAAASALALAGVLAVVGMMTEKKSTAAVASILMVLALLAVATWINAQLSEPEMNSGFIITVAGMELAEPTPNPRYVSGALRRLYELLLEILPSGQTVLLAEGAVARPGLQLGASLIIAVFSGAAGMALFEKKDLK